MVVGHDHHLAWSFGLARVRDGLATVVLAASAGGSRQQEEGLKSHRRQPGATWYLDRAKPFMTMATIQSEPKLPRTDFVAAII